jgi:sodium/hydrogen antiporter
MIVLSFGVVLLLAALASGLAHRSVLSTAVLFLAAGFVLGDGALGVVELTPESAVVHRFVEIALFGALFVDGMSVCVQDLRAEWRSPTRMLVLGLPLALVITAGLAHFLLGLAWQEALLLGAALAPTDPVLAQAIVGRKQIPFGLRHALNVESGVNDGLALPLVVVLLAIVADDPVSPISLFGEVAAGVTIGVVVPWVALMIGSLKPLARAQTYRPLYGVAIAFIVFGLSSITHGNEFLAAFAAGITVATVAEDVTAHTRSLLEPMAELLKLSALLVFGSLLSFTFFGDVPLQAYLFALAALLVARPVSVGLAMWHSDMATPERIAAAWFGPKGFASVVFGLLILSRDLSISVELFHLIGLVVTFSIVLHSSTDVVVAQRFEDEQDRRRQPSTASRSPRGPFPAGEKSPG